MPHRRQIIGRIVIVMRSPTTEDAAAVATAAVSVVSLLRLQICNQMDAISAATPLASLTTKVCMEKITLSSRL